MNWFEMKRMCRRENRYGAHSDEVPRKLIITPQGRVVKEGEFRRFVTNKYSFVQPFVAKANQLSPSSIKVGQRDSENLIHEIFISMPKLSYISLSCLIVESIEK